MRRPELKTPWTTWLLVSVPVIMLAMFVVPYTLLREVDAWYGSLLFWTVGTAAVITINIVIALTWENEK
ncbi:hypothetical protein [Nesterenkonia sphaerica]|uniref:DUF3311 domain-containing protein n=1 Tax=Nesterenkonia sphaerica TaxID=1804988 RepID=A0A5R9A6U9_9MICC|nr:hypothetical protein [Nesterenkonia sphaerica]TLP74348.1 hypothetical protein FEF27_09350 [Nesterenkonia sphaerica]